MAEATIAIEVVGRPAEYTLRVTPDKTRATVGEVVTFSIRLTVNTALVDGGTIEVRHLPPRRVPAEERLVATLKTVNGLASYRWTVSEPLGIHRFRFTAKVPAVHARPVIRPEVRRYRVASGGQLVPVAEVIVRADVRPIVPKPPVPIEWIIGGIVGVLVIGGIIYYIVTKK